jgi:hypothetical protein
VEIIMITGPVPTVIKRIKHFFAARTSSGQRHRSAAGLLLTLVLLPLLLGVMACLPVPVGDPEKSRIDPSLSGVWNLSDADGGQMIMVLDPYDKHTWLMSLIDLSGVADGASAAPASPGDDDAATAMPPQPAFSAANADRLKVTGMSIYKCWLTRIKGETFMTWESKTLSETLPGMIPEAWWVFRVRKSGADIFYLDSFDYEIDGLIDVKTSKQAKQIIRRHVNDPGFFEIDSSPRLERVPASAYAALSRLLEDFGIEDTL